MKTLKPAFSKVVLFSILIGIILSSSACDLLSELFLPAPLERNNPNDPANPVSGVEYFHVAPVSPGVFQAYIGPPLYPENVPAGYVLVQGDGYAPESIDDGIQIKSGAYNFDSSTANGMAVDLPDFANGEFFFSLFVRGEGEYAEHYTYSGSSVGVMSEYSPLTQFEAVGLSTSQVKLTWSVNTSFTPPDTVEIFFYEAHGEGPPDDLSDWTALDEFSVAGKSDLILSNLPGGGDESLDLYIAAVVLNEAGERTPVISVDSTNLALHSIAAQIVEDGYVSAVDNSYYTNASGELRYQYWDGVSNGDFILFRFANPGLSQSKIGQINQIQVRVTITSIDSTVDQNSRIVPVLGDWDESITFSQVNSPGTFYDQNESVLFSILKDTVTPYSQQSIGIDRNSYGGFINSLYSSISNETLSLLIYGTASEPGMFQLASDESTAYSSAEIRLEYFGDRPD